jgi:hypothetical protein
MTTEPAKEIKVTPASDLTQLLHDAAAHPILLENNGELYRLERMGNTSTTPTPEEAARSRESILKAAGSWRGMDTEAFKAYVADRRRTTNRPAVKL